MNNSIMQPIAVKSFLAGNPQNPPKYSVELELSGKNIPFVDPKATRALIALMDMQSVLGGAASHFGGPSAFAEIMSAIYGIVFHRTDKTGKPWNQKFHVINDAGHCENGIYALKANYGYADLTVDSLKGFRSIQSQLTGHGESHIFPEGVYLSNGPLGSSLPQAQGLCFADALAGRDRVTITTISDGACMEGEAKEALAAIPGLASKGRMNPFLLVISDNNTKLSGRIDEQSFSMEPTFSSLKDLGWKVLHLDEAHQMESCVSKISEALELAEKGPVALIAKTVKGYGTEKTANSSSGAHGFPLKDPKEMAEFLSEIYQNQEVPQEFRDWTQEMVTQVEKANEKAKVAKEKASANSSSPVVKEKVQVGVAKALIEARQKGLPLISVTSDLPGSTGLSAFHKEFPQCFVDVGIAESNMVSMAAGLSKEGFIPIVDTFSQFGATKGALPLLMASLSEAPMIAIFSHAGFQDAADGASHQALNYFSMTSSLPNVNVYSLTCSQEAEALVGQAIETFAKTREAGKVPSSSVFFLGRENFPQMVEGYSEGYELGSAQVVFDNSDKFDRSVTLVGAGPLLFQAMEAAHSLETESIGAVVVNPSVISSPDIKTLRTALKKTQGRMVTVEDHQIKGGMSSYIAQFLLMNEVPVQMKCLGVMGVFGQSAYLAKELYEKHNLDSGSILKESLSFFQ